MAKWVSIVLAASGAVGACTYTSAVEEPNRGETSAGPRARPAFAQRGTNLTRLYNDTCAKCHGENGQGGGAGTPSLNTREKFDQKWDQPFFDAIKNGVPHAGMEAYGETLSDEEIWGLVVHIRELQARALRSEEGGPKMAAGVTTSRYHRFRTETVVDAGLRTPWGIDWLPDGRMLVTNRGGELSVVQNGRVVATVEGTPATAEIGQGGLMEVAVHPDAARNGWVYLAYTEPAPNNPRAGQTKVVRGKLTGTGDRVRWTGQQTVFQAPPEAYTPVGVHFGSRIVFDRKGHVFFAIGERGAMQAAQDPNTSVGKIFRVREDGSLPADNPFRGRGKVADAVWSMGHRNPQGLVLDLQGNLWDTEHGPRGGDEVNLIKPGLNYGWPTHAFSVNYNDSPFRTPWPKAGERIELPVFRWLPSIGACGLDVARGKAFPKWSGDLLAGGLSGQNVDRLRMRGGKLVEREEIVHGMGRVREVAVAPDGTVYVALNGPDKIVRLVPVP